MPPDELRRRIRKAIESHIDWGAWNRALAVEKTEKESIENFVGRWEAGRKSVPVMEESGAEARPKNEVAPMGHVSAANIKPPEEMRQADPELFEAISGGKTTLAHAGCKVKKKRKATAMSRRLAELGLTGLVTEKVAKECIALARLPKDISQDVLDDKISLAEAKRRARRKTAQEKVGRRGVRPEYRELV